MNDIRGSNQIHLNTKNLFYFHIFPENSDVGNKGTAYSSVWLYKSDVLKK